MRASQLDAFSAAATLPDGFRYQPDVLTVEQERQLLQQIATLRFKAFEFRGFEGKRRTVSYGWRYDFNQQTLQQADPVADFLLPARDEWEHSIPPVDILRYAITMRTFRGRDTS